MTSLTPRYSSRNNFNSLIDSGVIVVVSPPSRRIRLHSNAHRHIRFVRVSLSLIFIWTVYFIYLWQLTVQRPFNNNNERFIEVYGE